MEENQVEQTAENNEVQETEQKPVENTFTQDQVTEIVKKRLAQERSQMYKKLGVDYHLKNSIQSNPNSF